MFGRIYKINGGDKYHILNKESITNCGLKIDFISEDRIIGVKGNLQFVDPNKKNVCRTCFKFLKFDDDDEL